MAIAMGNGDPIVLGLQGVLTLWLAFLALFVLNSHEVEVGRNDISKEEILGMIRQLSILNTSSVMTSQQSRKNYISSEEDLELEKQLRILNKPPIKTFLTEEGDIIDCVDMYKQPAFDHSLLKNHKLQLRPSFFPTKVANETASAAKPLHVKLKAKECPPGTVPIRRTSKEDLITAKSISRSFPTSFSQKITHSYRGKHRVFLKKDNDNLLHGVSAFIDVYNPSVKAGQFSTAQVWAQAQNGPHDQLNNIQAGWMVYPHLYHDNRTRLFTYWTADGFHNTGCFNILCPVFVQIDKTFTPSMVLQPISVYGGTQYVIYVNVYQDLATKNWWLMVTNRNIVVGYWPSAIFSYLNEGASSVVWGAVAQSSPDHISPPMGSGHFPYDNYNHSCFFTNMKFMNRFNKVMNADGLKKFVNNTNCYDIKDDRYKSKELEHSLRFGGRGGNCYLLPQSSKGPLFSIRM